MIAILDYGIGNIYAVQNMLKKIGYRNALLINDPGSLSRADKIIIPGVGNFAHCMKEMKNASFFKELNRLVKEKEIPILGICVGHQMLFEYSEEGNCTGLGWVPGNVIKFKKQLIPDNLKIPHMGWSTCNPTKEGALFKNIEDPRFYFVHSYHAICSPDIIMSTTFYGYEFVSSIKYKNIMGVQFHPEKSHKFGMELFKNFISI